MKYFWTAVSIALVISIGTINHGFSASSPYVNPEMNSWSRSAAIYLHQAGGTPLPTLPGILLTGVGLAIMFFGLRRENHWRILRLIGWLLIVFCWTPFIAFLAFLPLASILLQWVIMGFGTTNPYSPFDTPPVDFPSGITPLQVRQRWSETWQTVLYISPRQKKLYTLWGFITLWSLASVLLLFASNRSLAGDSTLLHPLRDSRANLEYVFLLVLAPVIVAAWVELLVSKIKQPVLDSLTVKK